MDAKTLNARIAAANEKYVLDDNEAFPDNHKAEEEAISPQPKIDLYQMIAQNKLREGNRLRPNGASPKIKNEAELISSGWNFTGLKRAYKMAKSQVNALMSNGDTLRAKMLMQQYMDEQFLPAVEALVRLTSADNVINSTDVLRKLDSMVLTSGGNPSGFTRSFIEQLYNSELGTTEPTSDGFIKDAIMRIKAQIENGQIRTAVGVATKALNDVNNGTHSADDSDYSILLKVAERGQ